nr:ribonucleoside-diphosphate reductase subunit alpha [Burkholderiaceae bacterium]
MQFQEMTMPAIAAGGAAAAARIHDPASADSGATGVSAIGATSFGDYKVIRRNGSVVAFEPSKIAVAMTKAFIAVRGAQGAGSAAIREQVEKLTDGTVRALLRRLPAGGTFHIEDVQDQAELSLMRDGAHDVARSYVLYREKRAQERAKQSVPAAARAPQLSMLENGVRVPLDMARVEAIVRGACVGLTSYVTPDAILSEMVKNLYDGVPLDEVYKSAILASRALIEKDPAYAAVSARLLLHTVRREVLGEEIVQGEMQGRYADAFARFVKTGISVGLLDERLGQFDLKRLGSALDAGRDLNFHYLGLQTLYDRYFLHHDGRRFELPQVFFMRVAMGLALNEIERDARAIEFYEVLSSFDFMSSTPTLFNSGTKHSQLSSCYLSTV